MNRATPLARLQDKVAIITGGAGDLGAATARTFVREGAKVVLVDVSEEALGRTAEAIRSDAVSSVVADVTQPDQVRQAVDVAVNRHGGVDVFMANAGIEGAVAPIAEYPVDVFDRVMAVNVRGVWLSLKYAMPVLAQRGGGSIVITSSIAGIKGTAGVSAYITSKHAVIGLMRTAALEGAPAGVRVNCVNPAPVDSRMMRSLEEGFAPGAADAARQALTATIPLKRYGTPDEVASLVLFLASDESRYCTGGVYMVDGGVSA